MRAAGHRRHHLTQLLTVSLLVLVGSPAAASPLRLEPDRLRISAFFAGARVHVSADIPTGADAIIEVYGKRIEEQLLRKGRHWDIWMAVGEIDIEEAPCLYYALSTDPASLPRAGRDTEFGYDALKKRMSFRGDVEGMSHAEIFDQFIALKEDEKLYALLPGALSVSSASGSRSTIEGAFHIPPRVAPGDYQVRLSILDHGRVSRTESARLTVHKVGVPAFLSSLARQHGALHGLLAVAIAVMFGFLVGVVFRKRARAR